MKTVKIQSNKFLAESRPTTQEDNFGEILDRWDLFKEICGEIKKAGRMVKYFDGSFAVFHEPMIRYNIDSIDVSFI